MIFKYLIINSKSTLCQLQINYSSLGLWNCQLFKNTVDIQLITKMLVAIDLTLSTVSTIEYGNCATSKLVKEYPKLLNQTII